MFGTMRQGQSSRRKPRRLLAKVKPSLSGEPNILMMPVPWDNYQGHQQLEWSRASRLELRRRAMSVVNVRAREVSLPLWGLQNCYRVIDIKHQNFYLLFSFLSDFTKDKIIRSLIV